MDWSVAYPRRVPQLWNETIEAHRRDVREAIIDTTAALVLEQGLRSVTMSQIAQETGIGRATLYKYFPGVDEIMVAWHERQVAAHVEELSGVARRSGDVAERLRAVLERFALISYEHHGSELAAVVHRGEHHARAHAQLSSVLDDLLAEGAAGGELRSDVPPSELATYCLHALVAASSLESKAAVRRLVAVTLQGLRP